MPVAYLSYYNQKLILIKERQSRTAKVRNKSLEMLAKCNRYTKKNLRYFIDTATRQYACYIAVKAKYSLFISNKKQERVQQEKRQKRLKIALVEEQAASLC